jgi:UDP-galactopyranose mutase
MSENKGQLKNDNVSNIASQQMGEGKPTARQESRTLKGSILSGGSSSTRTSSVEARDLSSLESSNKGLNGHAASTDAPDLVCLSHLRWNFVFQRPQHLLTRCAQGTAGVFYRRANF